MIRWSSKDPNENAWQKIDEKKITVAVFWREIKISCTQNDPVKRIEINVFKIAMDQWTCNDADQSV